MRFDVVSLFPELVEHYCCASILGRAQLADVYQLHTHQLRDYGLGKHRSVDARPFGGGVGQLMRVEPFFAAHDAIPKLPPPAKTLTLAFTPRGQRFSQPFVREVLVPAQQIIMLCGRYEGMDERVMSLVDYQVSLGNYVLTGGELAAMTVIDAVTRLLPGTFDKGLLVSDSDSFSDLEGQVLEAPQYTRPREFRGMSVPEVLLNGNHQEIQAWRETYDLSQT